MQWFLLNFGKYSSNWNRVNGWIVQIAMHALCPSNEPFSVDLVDFFDKVDMTNVDDEEQICCVMEEAKKDSFVFLMALLPPSLWLFRVYSASTQFSWISICPGTDCPAILFTTRMTWIFFKIFFPEFVSRFFLGTGCLLPCNSFHYMPDMNIRPGRLTLLNRIQKDKEHWHNRK